MPGAATSIYNGIQWARFKYKGAKGMDALVAAIPTCSMTLTLTPNSVLPPTLGDPNGFNAYATSMPALANAGVDLAKDKAIYTPIIKHRGAEVYRRLGDKLVVMFKFDRNIGIIIDNTGSKPFPMAHPLVGIAAEFFGVVQPSGVARPA